MSWGLFLRYEIMRELLSLGIRVRPILEALEWKGEPGSLLDAGCGFGTFSRHFPEWDYTGIDLDEPRIGWARKYLGGPKRRFLKGDVCAMNFQEKSFDKAVAFGVLHHLDDAQCGRFLSDVSRLTRRIAVFCDPVYSERNPLNNLICRLDQGRFVRTSEGYMKLFPPSLRVINSRTFYSHTGMAKFFLTKCIPV